MRRLDFLLTGFLAVLLTSCGQRVQNTDSKPAVKIDTVLSADRQIALQFPGRVKAAQDISLSFRVSGTIQYMHVNDGAYVRKGQLLAELDPTDYQIQLDAAEAEYQSVKAEAERVMALYKENVTTPDANDKAVYGLRQITAKYNHAKDQLAYTRLYAPFSGYVQKRLFDSHETVAAGMPVVSIISEGSPEVEINLPAVEYIRRQQFTRYYCTFDISILRENGRTSIFLYDASSHAIRRCDVTVTRLLSDGRCLITSGEVNPGDLVVASGVHHVKEGEQVEPLLPATETNVGGLL